MTDRRASIAAAKATSDRSLLNNDNNRWCRNNTVVLPSNKTNSRRVPRTKRTQFFLWVVMVVTAVLLRSKLPSMTEVDEFDRQTKNATETIQVTKMPKTNAIVDSGNSVTTTTKASSSKKDIASKNTHETKKASKKKKKTTPPSSPPSSKPNVDERISPNVPSEEESPSSETPGSSSSSAMEVPERIPQQDNESSSSSPKNNTPNDSSEESETKTKPDRPKASEGVSKERPDADSDSDNDNEESGTKALPANTTTTSESPLSTIQTTTTKTTRRQPLTDADLSPTALEFARDRCDLSDMKRGQWFPSGEENSWKQRAPYLIISGVWNAGVIPLTNALLKHPSIERANCDGFFLPRQFYRYFVRTTKKIKVFSARQRMYANAYTKSNFVDSTDRLAIDVSPGLVFYAHQTAPSILCTAPWAKIVIVLRNPIDRLYQQWVYSTTNHGLKLSLEEWMAPEMKLLQTVGLIHNKNSKNDRVSEPLAWERYHATRGLSGLIGRSLYVLQLQEWFDAYIAAGKIPSEEIIILTTEDIEADPHTEYSRLLSFLGLSLHESSSISESLAKSLLQRTTSTKFPPMNDDTRASLKKFFRPYNKRLAKLLESNGFEGNWVQRWNH